MVAGLIFRASKPKGPRSDQQLSGTLKWHGSGEAIPGFEVLRVSARFRAVMELQRGLSPRTSLWEIWRFTSSSSSCVWPLQTPNRPSPQAAYPVRANGQNEYSRRGRPGHPSGWGSPPLSLTCPSWPDSLPSRGSPCLPSCSPSVTAGYVKNPSVEISSSGTLRTSNVERSWHRSHGPCGTRLR